MKKAVFTFLLLILYLLLPSLCLAEDDNNYAGTGLTKRQLEERCKEKDKKKGKTAEESFKNVSDTDLEALCKKLEEEKNQEQPTSADIQALKQSIIEQLQAQGWDPSMAAESIDNLEQRMNYLSELGYYAPGVGEEMSIQALQSIDNYLKGGGDPFLADNILLHIGNPKTIDQGNLGICNYCHRFEIPFAKYRPDRYADMVTQVASTSSYNGRHISADLWKTFSGNNESYFTMDNALSGGHRSPASKIVRAVTRGQNMNNAPVYTSETRSLASQYIGQYIPDTSDYGNNPARIAQALSSGEAPYIAMLTMGGRHIVGLHNEGGRLFVDNSWGGESTYESTSHEITAANISRAHSLVPKGSGGGFGNERSGGLLKGLASALGGFGNSNNAAQPAAQNATQQDQNLSEQDKEKNKDDENFDPNDPWGISELISNIDISIASLILGDIRDGILRDFENDNATRSSVESTTVSTVASNSEDAKIFDF